MASFNSSLFLSLMVAISAFMAAPSSVEAQLEFRRINGTVRIAIKMTLVQDGTIPVAQSPFANTAVELICRNITLANVTLDDDQDERGLSGYETIQNYFAEAVAQAFISFALNQDKCKAIFKIPLAQCNATLPLPSVGELEADVAEVHFFTIAGVNIINPVIKPLFRLRGI